MNDVATPITAPPEASDGRTFFRYFGRLPGTWWILGISIFAGLFEGVGLTLFVPLLAVMDDSGTAPGGIVALVTRVFNQLDLPLNVPMMLAAITGLIVTGFFLGYVQRRAVHKAFNDYILTLRYRLMGGMLHASWPYLSQRATGEVVNNLILETSQTSTGLMMQVHMVTAAIQVFVLAAFSATLSLELVGIVVVFTVLMIVLSRPFLRRSDQLGKGLTRANQTFGFHSVDYLRGAHLIKTTASEEPALERINKFSEQVYRMRLGLDLVSALFQFVLQVGPALLVAAVILVAHGLLGLSTASVLAFLLIMARIMPRFGEIQQRYQAYLSYRPAMGVVDRMIAACDANAELKDRGGVEPADITTGIRFEAVDFRYSGDATPVLHDVSFDIPKNHFVALVGSSGSGKSTVISLLAGLYRPTAGKVLVNDTDLESVDLRAWRRGIGYVTQDVITFNDTIRSNVSFMCPDAPDETIREALKIAHLDEFIQNLPDGLETMVGENGVRLSGGQKQRLALARALVGKPQLLLLDEATSALDNESERIVQRAIETLAHKITIVVVAHRLSTVNKANVIHVLENGRIVETGSYDDLLREKGRFAELYDLQFA